jgi:hypothetical protein
MGEVHALERGPDGDLTVRNRYTGETTPVAIDPDKRGLLALPAIPGACPLFRRDEAGTGICPVHETWPAVCAEYACWRLLVMDPGGRRAARVMGSRHIAIDDHAVDDAIAPHRDRLATIADDEAWDEALTELLCRAGWRVIR